MKRFFFLQTEISFFFSFLMIWAFISPPLLIEIPVLLFSSLVLFLFRRSPVIFRDTVKSDGEIYLSPVNGTVKSVRHFISVPDYSSPCHEVRVSINFWDEKGLYLPTAGELSYLKANKGKKIKRSAESRHFYDSIDELARTDFSLTSKNKTETMMRFIDCRYGKRPTIWLKSGDKGRGGACFGYYPFGGTLLIYLPQTSDILVFENERLSSGQSVIASIKDEQKV